jgi:hypothetical protein
MKENNEKMNDSGYGSDMIDDHHLNLDDAIEDGTNEDNSTDTDAKSKQNSKTET